MRDTSAGDDVDDSCVSDYIDDDGGGGKMNAVCPSYLIPLPRTKADRG